MRHELTWQAVVSAILVAAIIAAAYPYVVLKLGMGPNISVVSAFLGALLLMGLAHKTHGQNRLMNNIVQTAGTSAGSTAFMCVVAAAVELAAQTPSLTSEHMNHVRTIPPWPMFWWLLFAGCLGVLVIVPFRQHFLDDPKMIFADGVAAAETITVLDTPGAEARDKLRALGLSALVSAVTDFFREVLELIHDSYPAEIFRKFSVGMEWSLLSVGTGLLIGLNVSLSMLAATLLLVVIGPAMIDEGIGKEIVLNGVRQGHKEKVGGMLDRPWQSLSEEEQGYLKKQGGKQAVAYTRETYFPVLLSWFMWPATALMISAAITAVLLQWRAIVASLRKLQVTPRGESKDVSMKTVLGGSVLCIAGLLYVQHVNFGMSWVQTLVAVLCSLPLILVGVRVLGETNNGPVSVMMNGLQAVFALFWPTSIGHNLIASGVAGSCNVQGQGTIQDFKTGQILGSTPRILTWVQLLAVPIGAAAVAIMYPLLTTHYELGQSSLPAPTGVKISNMAILLSQGIDALPRGALLWSLIATVIGIGFVLIQHYRPIAWLPSAAGFGWGLILPGTLNVAIAVGGIGGWLWQRYHKESYDRYMVTVASGLIAGEAILAGLVLPVLASL